MYQNPEQISFDPPYHGRRAIRFSSLLSYDPTPAKFTNIELTDVKFGRRVLYISKLTFFDIVVCVKRLALSDCNFGFLMPNCTFYQLKMHANG